MLTFLNGIVINKNRFERISSLKYREVVESVQKEWNDSINNNIILYNLDDDMRDYVRVLVRELQGVMAKDLSIHYKTYIPSNNAMQYVALSELNNSSISD